MVKATMRKLAKPVLHTTGWLLFFIVPFISFPLSIVMKGDQLIQHSVLTLTLAMVFYINFLVLIPRFLKARKYLLYFIFAISLCFAFSAMDDYIFMKATKGPAYQRTLADGPPPEIIIERPPRKPSPFKGVSFFATITILSIGIRMTSEWFNAEKKKKELENEKLKVELVALKAQINPHFFFNVMNSLCSLARKKSDDTEKYIIKLSDIFRYNLITLQEEKVSLHKELQFIKNYIDIQYIRIPGLEPAGFDIKGDLGSVLIEPMLLFPFIENAFKHGASGNQPLSVNICLHALENNQVYFRTTNTVPFGQSRVRKAEKSGIGQENIRRRLNLLYPGKHHLNISQENNVYIVELKLDLSC